MTNDQIEFMRIWDLGKKNGEIINTIPKDCTLPPLRSLLLKDKDGALEAKVYTYNFTI